MKFQKHVGLCALVGMMGCSAGGPGDATQSGFVQPSSFGGISRGLTDTASGGDRDGDNGYAYQVGATDGEGFAGYAGILPGTNVGSAPPTGSATYTGRYEVGMIEDISASSSFIYGRTNAETGTIDLVADFDDGSLTGDSGQLAVDGSLNGSDIGGGVTYRGVNGSLDGLIGPDQAVGAFHGNNGELIYVGGFIVDAPDP